jgi:hypothetical protein
MREHGTPNSQGWRVQEPNLATKMGIDPSPDRREPYRKAAWALGRFRAFQGCVSGMSAVCTVCTVKLPHCPLTVGLDPLYFGLHQERALSSGNRRHRTVPK